MKIFVCLEKLEKNLADYNNRIDYFNDLIFNLFIESDYDEGK